MSRSFARGIPASAAFEAENDTAGAALESAAAAPKSQGDSVDLGDLDEAVLDEDMLRELVSDIVRKELSGDLGERITRNVPSSTRCVSPALRNAAACPSPSALPNARQDRPALVQRTPHNL